MHAGISRSCTFSTFRSIDCTPKKDCAVKGGLAMPAELPPTNDIFHGASSQDLDSKVIEITGSWDGKAWNLNLFKSLFIINY